MPGLRGKMKIYVKALKSTITDVTQSSRKFLISPQYLGSTVFDKPQDREQLRNVSTIIGLLHIEPVSAFNQKDVLPFIRETAPQTMQWPKLKVRFGN